MSAPKKKVWERITSKNWCKRYFSKFNHTLKVRQHCTVGWINEVYPDIKQRRDALVRLTKVIDKEAGPLGITGWNDRKTTTFRMVKKALKKANI